MIIENLTVTDFRVFQGKHNFSLSPRKRYKKKQPIILFGGLNGAGKTTILTAIRLALYGRQSLGPGTSQKAYEQYLQKSIHRARNTTLQANYSSIELCFSYSNMGIESHYKVVRNWTMSKKKFQESLAIHKDNEKMDSMSYEHCQGFLNELIPIGVSDLFFFDGERIKELAEDTAGRLLSEAIKKLLGLDLIERLNADLSVLLRNQDKMQFTKKDREEITTLESELIELENKAARELEEYENKNGALVEAENELEVLMNNLDARGGAWAASKEQEAAKQGELQGEKKLIENQLRDIFNGSYPLSLAPQFMSHSIDGLKDEAALKKHGTKMDAISSYKKKIHGKLKDALPTQDFDNVNSIIRKEFELLKKKKPKVDLLHDVTESLSYRVEAALNEAINEEKPLAIKLSEKLRLIVEQLNELGMNIARAPDQDTLTDDLKEIKKLQKIVSTLSTRAEKHRTLARQHYRAAIDVSRKLGVLHSRNVGIDDALRVTKYIDASKNLLKEFSEKAAKQKVKDLEREFVRSFRNLARKEDISVRAKIDPLTFQVSLVDNSNKELDKDELSAGEKQIYAIAILEALAMTSGRRLPIIIDTPLARLDSNHRSNIVEKYFPYSSQQVIILSTDTEVDERYYATLNKHVSHAYKLEYDQISGSTFAVEGYFWNKSKAA